MKLKELICKIFVVLCLVGLFKVGINNKVYADEQKIINYTSFGEWVNYEGNDKITYKIVPKKSGVYNIVLRSGYCLQYGTLYNSDKKFIGCLFNCDTVDDSKNEFYMNKGKTYYAVIEKRYFSDKTENIEFDGQFKVSYDRDVNLEEYTYVKVKVGGYDISNGYCRFEGISYDPEKQVLEFNNYTGDGDITIVSPYDFEVDEKDNPNFLNFKIKITGNNTVDLDGYVEWFFNIYGHGNFNVVGDGTLNMKCYARGIKRNNFIVGHGCNIIIDGPTIIADKIHSVLIETNYTGPITGKLTFKSGTLIINSFVNCEECLLAVVEAGAVDMSGGIIRINYVVNGTLDPTYTHAMFEVHGKMNVTGGKIVITGEPKSLVKVKSVEAYGKMSDKTKESILLGSKIQIQKLNIKLEKYTYKYDGKAKTPKVIINGLEEGKDFTVSYEDNVKPGIAKVTVKGIGSFWGSKKLKFIISGRENTKEGTTQSYDGIHGLQLSSIFDDGKLIYKVTKEGTLDGKTAGKVTVIELKKKTLKKVTVKASVNYGGVKYKVTAIGKKAFKKGKKLKSIVIGKNVAKIGKRAFAGCKKLKSIKIKSKKIKKFVKGTFKGLKKTCVIKVPKAKNKVYAKKIKKAGFKGIVR